MSSPNHPTTDVKDAFSSSFSDYVPSSPGKTFSSTSNSFGVVPIASPSLSLFHNDPYMKVLQAFYAKESPIPPPNPITPPVILTPYLKKPNSNSQDMAFISSSKNSNNEDGNTVCVTTATTAFPTGGVNVATISQDTANAFIASQSNGSQIKFEDINQIDEDDMEEMDLKWNMALLSIRADKFWKRTGKKISIQGSDVAGFDKSKVECFNCHKMGHFARECRAPRSQERVRKESYRQGSKAKEKSSKALMAIDGVGWDWSYMANE
nr:hypothetical protein [Tanacetum cinerariifolium]